MKIKQVKEFFDSEKFNKFLTTLPSEDVIDTKAFYDEKSQHLNFMVVYAIETEES